MTVPIWLWLIRLQPKLVTAPKTSALVLVFGRVESQFGPLSGSLMTVPIWLWLIRLKPKLVTAPKTSALVVVHGLVEHQTAPLSGSLTTLLIWLWHMLLQPKLVTAAKTSASVAIVGKVGRRMGPLSGSLTTLLKRLMLIRLPHHHLCHPTHRQDSQEDFQNAQTRVSPSPGTLVSDATSYTVRIGWC